MLITAYIRVGLPERANSQPHLTAGPRPVYRPLSDNKGPIPTVSFAVALQIPDEMFTTAEQVIAELQIEPDQCRILSEVQP